MMKPRTIAFAAAILLSGCAEPSKGATAQGNEVGIANVAVPETPADSLPANKVADADENQSASADSSHATVTESLKHELVGIGKIDGQPITDVTAPSRCETVFASKGASAAIHWTKVGNFAPQTSGATVSISIDDGSGAHQITMPADSPFRRVDGSLGLLADDCSGAE